MAEVAVEAETGRVKVLKVTAVNDLGTVIKRQIVEGQIISVPEVEVVSVIRILNIVVCFEFRASNFGFSLNFPRPFGLTTLCL
jgi:hypothetical protein